MAGIGPADQGLPPQIADSFRQKAKGRGLEDPEIDAITTYVLEHFAQWAQCDEDVVVKKGQGSGLARTIEYLHQSKTVVLHFKRKGGGALGEGRFSIVKPSIVVCSQTLPSGADLADKVAKDKTRAGQEREAYVSSQLVDAKHVRKVIRCSERGLLLEGMAQDLATRLKDWKSMTEIDRMGIAYHIIKGLRELHGADFSHQDLHAGNCFQSESGVWKIGDLGCAQRLGEIQTAELNLAVASPAAISARVFGFSHICSIEDDLWALALLLYRLRYGRAPEFSTSQAIQGMMDALAERDACYEAMRSLTDEQRKILFTCRLRSEEEIPPELREHAERLKSVWQSMRSHYKKYSEDLHVFHDSFAGWSEELGQLITQLFASENLNEGWLEKAESRLAPYMRTYSRDNPVQQAIASTDEAPVLEFQAYGMGTEQAYSEDTVPFTNEDEEWRLVNPAMEQVKGAIQSEDCRALLDYIERGCNIVDWIDPVGNGILHQVALLHRGSGRRVSELLGFLCRCGADVNDRNPEGKTAAHLFAEAGDIDALYDLWILGADFGLIDQAGHKAEYYAEKAGVRFVDETKLLAVRSADFKWSHESYTNWYLNQAPILELLEARSDIDTELRQRLERTVLMSYFKVARQIVYSQPIATVQRNPLPAGSYHRNSSPWIMKVIEILRTSRGDLIQPISSPLFLDVMKRYFGPERYFEINGLAKLRDTFSALKQKYEAGAPTKYCYLDCSELKKDTPEYLLIDSIELCARKFLNEELRPFLFLFGLSKEHDLYYLRAISMGSPEGLRILNGLATYSGHVPPPEDAMRFAQEQPGGLKSILQEVGLPVAKLVTAGHGVPVIFPSFSDLLELNSFRQLKVLAETLGDLAPPYVQALASATADVLKALQDLPVDRSYSDEGIGDLLQISCLKIHNAMGMACGRWNNFDAFLNEISLIHHEIQNILYMASLRHGYEPGSYERDFIERITSGADPLVPEGLGDLTVSLQPSDMHCFHSILSAMEIQAGTPALCMCIGEKCYFEAVETVQGGTYGVAQLRTLSDGGHELVPGPLASPFHIVALDFHHNINTAAGDYCTEDVIGQLKALRERKQLASPCTVVIDTTLDLDDSPELRALLRDPELAEMIQSGALNVVWHRSAQKFDMLGEDNYYGGVVCCLNNGEAFQAFNERIRHPAAQLGGIYYQGLTHLQKAIGAARDDYVRRLRSNAELLYSEVSAASFSDLKIAPMQEGSQFFLHLRLPLRLSNLATHVVTALAALLARKGVIVSHRGSFGFARTNIIGIGSKGIRITAGLEDADTIKTIAQAIIELASKLQSASDECASYSELQELLRELVASSNSKARGSPPTESEP